MSLVGNAHLVSGDATTIDAVLDLLRAEGIRVEKNPDIYARAYAHFGVDDARELRERADLSAQGTRRVFIIAAPVITAEAQNALLKTLEEPPGNALFFIIVPAPEALLPTLRSRAQRTEIKAGGVASLVDAKEFLAASPAARLDMLRPLLEKGDDERRDISGIVMFLSSLERTLGGTQAGSTQDALQAIYRARKYMGDKGSLVKPLLEQVALLVPRAEA